MNIYRHYGTYIITCSSSYSQYERQINQASQINQDISAK